MVGHVLTFYDKVRGIDRSLGVKFQRVFRCDQSYTANPVVMWVNYRISAQQVLGGGIIRGGRVSVFKYRFKKTNQTLV